MKKQSEKTQIKQETKSNKRMILALGSILIIVAAFFVFYKFGFHKKSAEKSSVVASESKGWVFDCTQNNTGLESLNIYDITTNSSAVFLATYKGIYRSLDNGSTWSLFNKGIENNIISKFYTKDDLVYGLPFAFWKGSSELSYLYGNADEWSSFTPTGVGSFYVGSNLNQDSQYVLLRESLYSSYQSASKAGEKAVYTADDRMGTKNDFKLYIIGYRDEQHTDGKNLWNFKQISTPFDGYIRDVNNINLYDKQKKSSSLVSLIEVRKSPNDRKFYYQDPVSNEWIEYVDFADNKLANLSIFETGIGLKANMYSGFDFYKSVGVESSGFSNGLVLYNYDGLPEIDSPEYIRNYDKSKKTVINGLGQDVKLNKIVLLDTNSTGNNQITGTIAGYATDKGVYTCSFKNQ